MKRDNIDLLIHFHESMVRFQGWLMDPTTIYFEKQTAEALKELKVRQERENNG